MELTASEVWTKIRTDAKSVLPEQTFRTWLSSTEAVSLSDDTLVVAAPTKFAVEWIEDKYGQLLRELSEKQLGRVLQLRFEYHGTDDRLEFPEIGSDRPAAAPSMEPATATPPPAAALNERYKFDRFVVGGNNQLAAAACQRVSSAPATAYNPLFIWGGTGLGKTHLMHAIGHAIRERFPEKEIAYVPSEQFTNEMIAAIQGGSTAQFREHYRRIDVLLVDDVHFIGNKEGTQEEFFHTFNSLYDQQKQIVPSVIEKLILRWHSV